MKSLRIIALLLLLSPLSLISQIQFSPTAGYMFGGRLNYYQGELKIYDNVDYGISLIIPDVKFETDIEVYYNRMDSKAQFWANPGYDIDNTEFDLSVNYIQIGALKSINSNNDNIEPFGSFSLGTTIFCPKQSGIDDTWQFSITLGLGSKFWINDKVGIMIRGRLMMPMVFAGAGGYYGIGSGGSGGGLYVSSYTTIVQGDIVGGLIFSLGK